MLDNCETPAIRQIEIGNVRSVEGFLDIEKEMEKILSKSDLPDDKRLLKIVKEMIKILKTAK